MQQSQTIASILQLLQHNKSNAEKDPFREEFDNGYIVGLETAIEIVTLFTTSNESN